MIPGSWTGIVDGRERKDEILLCLNALLEFVLVNKTSVSIRLLNHRDHSTDPCWVFGWDTDTVRRQSQPKVYGTKAVPEGLFSSLSCTGRRE